jgi:transcriptional repressor NrdR
MANNINIGDSKVLESRETPDGTMIRRRRVTPEGRRFTTYERIEMPALVVRKRSGNKEQFDRDKLLIAVRRSVGKFFNSDLEVEDVVNKVVERVYDLGRDEIESNEIGQAILDVLAQVNEVAYVRFASVFLEFKTLEDFENIIRSQRESNSK